jgi:O-antigen/teichoic acid export membrane protein
MPQRPSEGAISGPSVSEGSRLTAGVKSTFVANVVIFAVTAAQSVVIVRLLERSDLGIYDMVRSIWDIVASLAGAGIGVALMKFAAEYRTTDRNRLQAVTSSAFALSFITTSAVFVALALSARSVAVKSYKEPRMTLPLLITSLAVALTVLHSQLLYFLQGLEKIVVLNRIRILHFVLTFLLAAILTCLYGIVGTFLGLLAGSACALVFSSAFALKAARENSVRLSPRFHIDALKQLLGYGIPTLLGSVIVYPAFLFGRSVIVRLYGDFSDLAGFRVGIYVSQVLLLTIPEAVAVPLIPMISNLNATDPQKAKALTVRVFRLTGVTALFATLWVATLARVGTPIVFGSQYSNEYFIVFAMSIYAFCVIVGKPIACYLAGVGKMWLLLSFDFFWFLLFIPSSYFLASRFGPIGLACAFLFTYLVRFALLYLYARERINLPWRDTAFLAAVAVPSLCASYYVLKYNLSTGMTLLAAALIPTCAASAILFSYKREQRKELVNLLRRLLRREPV